jgi:hypothetical protein
VYGEIEYASYAAALARVRAHGGLARPGGRFVDLGSGSGKAVFAAALLHDFDAALGIELLHSLHAEALKLLERWARDVSGHAATPRHCCGACVLLTTERACGGGDGRYCRTCHVASITLQSLSSAGTLQRLTGVREQTCCLLRRHAMTMR